uniref:Putative secreted protein n=1 Tax=Ixodes ricinus TaxID=34613 RepID=A0A6B0TVM7_IXORI
MSKNGKHFNDTFFLSFFVLHFCFASARSTPAAAVFGIMLTERHSLARTCLIICYNWKAATRKSFQSCPHSQRAQA